MPTRYISLHNHKHNHQNPNNNTNKQAMSDNLITQYRADTLLSLTASIEKMEAHRTKVLALIDHIVDEILANPDGTLTTENSAKALEHLKATHSDVYSRLLSLKLLKPLLPRLIANEDPLDPNASLDSDEIRDVEQDTDIEEYENNLREVLAELNLPETESEEDSDTPATTPTEALSASEEDATSSDSAPTLFDELARVTTPIERVPASRIEDEIAIGRLRDQFEPSQYFF